MTKTQRAVIEEIIRKAERGPSLSFVGDEPSRKTAEESAQRWSESWIAEPLRLLLDNVDGKVRAHQLEGWTR